MQRGSSDAGGLQDEPGPVASPDPGGPRTVGRPPPKTPVDDGAHVVLKAAEVAVGIEPWAGLEHQDLDALFGELLRDDRTAAARADYDDVSDHQAGGAGR